MLIISSEMYSYVVFGWRYNHTLIKHDLIPKKDYIGSACIYTSKIIIVLLLYTYTSSETVNIAKE